jgi:hypothetical protein
VRGERPDQAAPIGRKLTLERAGVDVQLVARPLDAQTVPRIKPNRIACDFHADVHVFARRKVQREVE